MVGLNNVNLYEWLKHEWEISNHAKYKKYFQEWLDNLTHEQLLGFNRMKNSDYINHNK